MAQGMMRVLIRARWWSLRNRLARLHHESIFKVVVVSGLGVAFWVGLFLLFSESFHFLNTRAYIFRELLLKNILSLFFLTLLLMLIFSNALISFGNLFRSPETSFLLSLPLRHETIYLYKMTESLVFSSWASFALVLPLLLAYGRQAQAGWSYYGAMLVYLIPFVLIPAGIGALLGLLLTALIPRHRGKFLALLGALVIGGAVWVALGIAQARAEAPGYGLGSEVQAQAHRILGRLEFTQHPLTPNFWITHGLLALSQETGPAGYRQGGLLLGALASSALFFVVLGWFISRSLYGRTYSLAAEVPRGRRGKSRRWFRVLLAPFLRRWPAVTVMVVKDVKTFLRDPVQWSQVLLFFGLLTVYIANLRNFSYNLERPFYQNLISFLNLGATCLTLATVVSRFVFPLISLEGQRFWVMGLAPAKRQRILVAKFLFSLGGALLITESLVVLSNYILHTGPFLFRIQTITAAFLCVGLTGLAVGMGAIFPSLRESNPSKIVSGFGGTLTLILSIFLVLFTVASEALVCHRFLVRELALDPTHGMRQDFQTIILSVLALAALLNGLAAYLPLRLGARALDRMEF